jgi:hypothetical protein
MISVQVKRAQSWRFQIDSFTPKHSREKGDEIYNESVTIKLAQNSLRRCNNNLSFIYNRQFITLTSASLPRMLCPGVNCARIFQIEKNLMTRRPINTRCLPTARATDGLCFPLPVRATVFCHIGTPASTIPVPARSDRCERVPEIGGIMNLCQPYQNGLST